MFSVKDFPIVNTPDELYHLSPGQVVVLNGDIGPLNVQQEASIASFVEQGGGLVCIGDAAEAYHEYELVGELLGNVAGICAVCSEIIAKIADPDHYITRRLDPSFAVVEAVYMLAHVPTDATILWQTRLALYFLYPGLCPLIWGWPCLLYDTGQHEGNAGTSRLSTDDRESDPLCSRR